LKLCLWGAVIFLAPLGVQGQSSQSHDSAFQHALISLRDGHLEDALAEFTAAERQVPSDARVRNFRGVTLAQLGRNEEATQEYREAIRLDPGMGDAYRNLGRLEWTEHKLDEAAADLRHAVALSASDSFAHYYLGRVLLDSKQYADALTELNRSSVPQPNEPEFLVQLVIANHALGRGNEEKTAIDRLVSSKLTPSQLLDVVDLLLSLKRSDSAVHLLQTTMQRQSSSGSWVRFDLARTYLIAQNYKDAAASAQKYIEASRKDLSSMDLASAWSLLGIAQANVKNSDAAVRALREAAKLESGNEEYCLNLTRELMDLARYDEAIAAIQASIASNPNSYALHLRLGAAYLASDRYADAEAAFRKLVDANDPLPISYVGLAQVLLRTGRAGEAVTELTAAELKLGPSFLIAYFRGLALKRAGRTGEAADAFAEAVRMNPSSAEARHDFGSTLLSLGKISEATSELEESLRLAPNDLSTRRLLSRAYARSGDKNRARENLEAEVDPPAPLTGLQGDFIIPAWQYPTADASK
jgi:tetratricopeptide (TPR) repeat protein